MIENSLWLLLLQTLDGRSVGPLGWAQAEGVQRLGPDVDLGEGVNLAYH